MFPDHVTCDLYYYEREQCDPKHERAAEMLDRMDEAAGRVNILEESGDDDALADARGEYAALKKEYAAVFDGDDYGGPDTVEEAS